MTDHKITLPPLPEGVACATCGEEPFYGHNHMRDYARAAVLLDRQQRAAPSAEPVAWMAKYDMRGMERVFCHSEREAAEFADGITAEPLYLAPPDHTALLRQALEALEERYIGALRDSALDALRAALEPKQC